jgi:2-hydroxy-3-oxopropionate reductase
VEGEERIGFIGLGVMGRPMAANLLGGGYRLVLHSRSRESATSLVDRGATWADSPAAVAEQAGTVISMLPDTPDVEAVLLGERGVVTGLRPGALVIDMSTIAPLAARRIGIEIESRGGDFLDAPVSGGQVGASEGTLTIMVGGDPRAFERAREVLGAMGTNVTLVGASGAGQVAKACNQLIVGANIEAVAEALVLAAAAGVDPSRVRDALLGGFASSRVLEIHGQRMLDANFAPGFRAALHSKDSRIILELAEGVGCPVPMFAEVAAALGRLAGVDGQLDHSALVTLREQDAGVRLGAHISDGSGHDVKHVEPTDH